MSYANRILEQWKSFDAFLSGIEGNKKLHWCVYMIRNLYVANQEIGVRGTDIGSMLTVVLHAFKLLVFSLVKKPLLRGATGLVLLEIHPEKDAELAKSINFSLGRIVLVADMRLRNIRRLEFIATWLTASWLLLRSPLNKTVIIKCLPDMLLGLCVYHLLDLNGVRVIVTQRDRYPVELAVLKKASESGIKTVRIEDFPSMGHVNRDTLFCDYYFCPNSINERIFKSFPQNNHVKFVDGGFPYWDSLAAHRCAPDDSPRIVSYWTQYGTEMGIFGSRGPAYYIEEVLNLLPSDAVLYIKVHPLDDPEKYKRYRSPKVEIVLHGDMPNAELMRRSSFIFSINSFSSFEAKHICPNAFFLNYHPEEALDFTYRLITDYIDLITNKEELKLVLAGERTPKDQNKFLSFFNPAYPHTCERLAKFVHGLQAA
jgi:hypothetical protein